ncbi:MAG: hypothetical protein KAQ67_10675, partial [Gammaproteobacteria bacterium]|nr:hypothetical protein [Gammaproteobacteria bacterium]
MKIKNKLYTLAGVSLILAAILTSIIFISSSQTDVESKRYQAARVVQNTTLALNTNTYKYLLQRENRTKRQWLNKNSTLSRILTKTHDLLVDNERLLLIDNMNNNQSALEKAFDKITKNQEKITQLKLNKVDKNTLDKSILLDQFLTSSLLLSMQSMVLNADKLAARS